MHVNEASTWSGIASVNWRRLTVTVSYHIRIGLRYRLHLVARIHCKLCAASRCSLSVVPEVVELKVEYRVYERLQEDP